MARTRIRARSLFLFYLLEKSICATANLINNLFPGLSIQRDVYTLFQERLIFRREGQSEKTRNPETRKYRWPTFRTLRVVCPRLFHSVPRDSYSGIIQPRRYARSTSEVRIEKNIRELAATRISLARLRYFSSPVNRNGYSVPGIAGRTPAHAPPS